MYLMMKLEILIMKCEHIKSKTLVLLFFVFYAKSQLSKINL